MNFSNTDAKAKRWKQNGRVFVGVSAGMFVCLIFMAFATGNSYGTQLAGALSGLFLGMGLAARKITERIQVRNGV